MLKTTLYDIIVVGPRLHWETVLGLNCAPSQKLVGGEEEKKLESETRQTQAVARSEQKAEAEYLTTMKATIGPCGIPENTGIPGFDSNTDTGISENKIPVFFGTFV